ncbi:MAG TPA: nitrite reductase small subunit NirD [Steroidobacteraceae bacterium]
MKTSRWVQICALEDIYPDSGVCALIEGQQVALFRLNNGVHAIGNRDPVSGVNVLSRGIVGDMGGELVVASPLYKQHFSLITGRCLEEPEYAVPVYLARIHDGQVWVRAEAVVMQHAAGKRRLVVIGNGVAAMRTIEELLELTPQAYDITVFGAEQHSPYNRVLLSPVLAGEKRTEEIITHPPQWFRDQGIVVHLADPVVHIDRARRCVRSRLGVEVGYDRLLIATGSVPVLLPVPGRDLPGVLTFRDLQDVDGMLAGARASRRAVVIGGGLLGLEAATGLRRRGMEVTVVHIGEYLMNQQLDAHAGELLRKELEGQGLKFWLSARTVSIHGSVQVTGVQLADGRELPADLVVMATGVRPNTELARAAGLRCDRGILVDDTLQSFDPAIYAVGECVQHRDSTFGLVAPLWEQARVCAAHLAERGVRRYGGSQVSTQLKVSGVKVFSAGDLQGGATSESLVLRDPRRGIYKRLLIEDNKVRGAVLYGDTGDGSWYFDLINEGRDVGSVRDTLLFGPTG